MRGATQGAVVFVLVVGYLYNADFKEALPVTIATSEVATIIDALTDESESIGLTTLDTWICMISDRAACPNVGGTPWHWEVYGEKWVDIDDITELPKIAIYEETFEVWGYKQVEYAPELKKIFNEYYVFLPTSSNKLYIRKDYYEEAMSKLEQAGIVVESLDNE